VKIAVTGTHGLIGRHLVSRLRADGHEVVALIRGPAGPGQVTWDPGRGILDASGLLGVEAVVNLAGVSIFGRWTEARRRAIRDSRVRATSLLVGTLIELRPPPSVLLNASAVGWYGDRGDEMLDESSGPGTGFLAELCRDWEQATAAAAAADIRTVLLRSGIVLAPDGGALKAQLPLFKLGLGGHLGRGTQWTSWISLEDEVGAIVHLLATDHRGPVNLTAPTPLTNQELARAIGGAVRRPAALAVPRLGLDIVFGRRMTAEMLMASQRAVPGVLRDRGYTFAHPTVEAALAAALRSR
jgi:uncharacterized protein (TIGR01777 family)